MKANDAQCQETRISIVHNSPSTALLSPVVAGPRPRSPLVRVANTHGGDQVSDTGRIYAGGVYVRIRVSDTGYS